MTTKCVIYMWTHPNPNDDAALRGERLWVCTPDICARLIASVTVGGARVPFASPTPLYHAVATHKLVGSNIDEMLATLSPEWAESEDAFLDRVRQRSVPPDAIHVRVVDASAIPKDRTFRNALKPDLTFDIAKCRTIHRERMRAARAPLLAALDVEYQRADEQGDNAAKGKVAARKKVLRDITGHPGIDTAKTPDQLKAVWPDILGGTTYGA